MKAIISRASINGVFPNVGTSNRVLVSHYRTKNGVRRFARKYAVGFQYRIEFFHSENFYGMPFAVETGRA